MKKICLLEMGQMMKPDDTMMSDVTEHKNNDYTKQILDNMLQEQQINWILIRALKLHHPLQLFFLVCGSNRLSHLKFHPHRQPNHNTYTHDS